MVTRVKLPFVHQHEDVSRNNVICSGFKRVFVKVKVVSSFGIVKGALRGKLMPSLNYQLVVGCK